MGKRKPVLNLPDIAGQRNFQPGTVVKLHQEKLVFRIGGFEELHRGHARALELAAHAAAGVEHQAHRNRVVVHGKLGDLLLHLVFQDAEVFLLQTGDRPV